MSVIVEFSMFPIGPNSSLGDAVAPIVGLVRDSGLDYRLTPMGTIIEAERLADALALVERAHSHLDAQGFERIYAVVKVDSRRGQDARLERKVDAVRRRIGEVIT